MDRLILAGRLGAGVESTVQTTSTVNPVKRVGGEEGPPGQDAAALLLARSPHLAGDLELHFSAGNLSEANQRRLRDRFGDGLTLYPSNGMRHRFE